MVLQLNPKAESFLLWGLYTMLFGALEPATSQHPPLPKSLCGLPRKQTPEALPSTILFVSSFFSPVLESWPLHTTYMTLQISSESHEPISWELPPRCALPP